MDPVVLGWPPDGPTLRLDYRRFSYAGKFVVSNTGKAVFRDEDETAADRRDGDGVTDDRRDGDGVTDDRRDGVTDDPHEEREPSDGQWDDGVLAAVAFSEDRTDPGTLWLRYVTVRRDRRGEGLGPRLCSFVAARAAERGYDRVRIAVNNPFAYEALYRAGFAFTGEETGLAELVLERPADAPAADRSASAYRDGLERYRERDLSDEETAFLERQRGTEPPDPVAIE